MCVFVRNLRFHGQTGSDAESERSTRAGSKDTAGATGEELLAESCPSHGISWSSGYVDVLPESCFDVKLSMAL